MKKTIKRGDIYYADLNPVIGSEQGGIRPVLIISNDMGNRHSPTVIAAAITSRTQAKTTQPTHVSVSGGECLNRDSIVLLEQIRTIDKKRLREFVGVLDRGSFAEVDRALAVSVGLCVEDNECPPT